MTYIAITVVQLRFFPIKVFTLGGDAEVEFRPATYHTLQAIQGALSIMSALLYLGKDSFCVSKRVTVNGRPAHQLCYDWGVGMRMSSVLGVAAVGVSVTGLIMSAIELLDAGGYSCIDTMQNELLCDGTLIEDTVGIGVANLQLNSQTTVSCLEKAVRTIVPLVYVVLYSLSFILSGLGAFAAHVTYQFYLSI
eukprot:CAMPEP_0206222592 /NCGR_PEP_ID=MMETSP0047_2-20121206/6039_1 /ASSEMBLY_ACC=CAM_ASM_000192 /TAXON_ID=195065 /ORGANISM="Chroomonas mesostigmatica_cf, Strain CCMP1168" /LENGTH=192 /DNA_ID=CAMNT_0053645421 /DNA_START=144 /DNA_END=722 /DNA_ORIENTATION=+